VLMDGSALPSAQAADCPSSSASVSTASPMAATEPAVAAAAPDPALPAPPITPPPPAAKPVQVIVTKCEERLRVGSDFLFDFDRAEARPEAEPALAELDRHIAGARKTVMIEGYTDARGSESYSQGLSERRAIAIRGALVSRGLPMRQLNVPGFGKSHPVAPNQNPDGTDDPDGRQQNRRVEVVINTCS
jgi:outer membrane protein OmpA-like peptidoglycan-associated protein